MRATFYVATDGNDGWSGALAAPRADGSDGPFATPDRARQAVAEFRRKHPGRKQPVVVAVRGGTYELDKPLTFTPADSGTAASPTIFAAYGTERPVFSAGRTLSGWKITEKGWWQLDLPEVREGEWDFSQLFVNGARRFRPRLPRNGYFRVAGSVPASPEAEGKGFDRFAFNPGELRGDWQNLRDVELMVFHIWATSTFRIRSVDGAGSRVALAGRTATTAGWQEIKQGARYLAMNVREALGRAGDWYLDRAGGTLTYVPLRGETPRRAEVIAPRLERIVVLEGDPVAGRWVRHIEFHGLTFAHSNWVLPPGGLSCPQADVCLPAAIEATGARGCVFERCAVEHTGGYAMALSLGCRNNRIADCEFTDLGGGGLKIGTTGSAPAENPAAAPLDDRTAASHTLVRNCLIAQGGRLHPAAVGVWIGQSHHNTVEHCEVADFYYSGFSVGWTWGYGPSFAHHNRIERNLVHRIGQRVLSDMGGIYTLGISPGTVIAGNVFHDVHSHEYGGWGMYTDEGSTGILMENNLVYDTRTGSFHQHYGKDNVIRNNILAFSEKLQLARSRVEEHRPFTFTRNIVYWKTGPLMDGNWHDPRIDIDRNLYWNAAGEPVAFAGAGIDEWRKLGKDIHSVVADPLFVNPDAHDFRLRRGSPAKTIGFKPFDAGKAGRLKGFRQYADLPAVAPAFGPPDQA